MYYCGCSLAEDERARCSIYRFVCHLYSYYLLAVSMDCGISNMRLTLLLWIHHCVNQAASRKRLVVIHHGKLFDRFDLVSRLFFVFQSIGSIFLKIPVFTTAIKRFVLGNSNSAAGDLEFILPNDRFVAECEGVLYLKGFLISEKILFKELHDMSLELGQPLATVLVSSQETCRICSKALVVESKVHLVVIYSLYRGTYLGSCVWWPSIIIVKYVSF